MNKTNAKNALLLFPAFLLPVLVHANNNTAPPAAFPDSSLKSWKEKSFVGNTTYELVEEQDTNVLKAFSDKTASVLYKKKTIDLSDTPFLEWSWKIDGIYEGIEEKTKSGDDYPARIYVTAKIGLLPWDTIAINYVWSSNQEPNTQWPSPYTEKAMMVAVQSGSTLAGNWVTQKRNIAEDFKRYFDVDIDKISGYAVMVDSDNALQSGTAYFGNIDFLAE